MRASQESLTKLVQDFETQLMKTKEKYEDPTESVEEALIRHQLEIEYEEEQTEKKFFQQSSLSATELPQTNDNSNYFEDTIDIIKESDKCNTVMSEEMTNIDHNGFHYEELKSENYFGGADNEDRKEPEKLKCGKDDTRNDNEMKEVVLDISYTDKNHIQPGELENSTSSGESNGLKKSDNSKNSIENIGYDTKIHQETIEPKENRYFDKEARCTGCYSESLTLSDLFTHTNGAEENQDPPSISSPSKSVYKLSPSNSSTMESISEEVVEKLKEISVNEELEFSRPATISCRLSSSSEEFVTPMLSPEEQRREYFTKQNYTLSLPTKTSISQSASRGQYHNDIKRNLSPRLAPKFTREFGNDRLDFCEMCESNDDTTSICSLDYLRIEELPDEYLDSWMER